MSTVRIYKAQQTIVGDRQPAPTTIVIDEEIPAVPSLVDARKLYQREAARLANALFDALPGGTLDQLLAEMLERKASLLRVRFTD
jgi:hypothetical protein